MESWDQPSRVTPLWVIFLLMAVLSVGLVFAGWYGEHRVCSWDAVHNQIAYATRCSR